MARDYNSLDLYSTTLLRIVKKLLQEQSYNLSYTPGAALIQVPDKNLMYQAKIVLMEGIFTSSYYDSPLEAIDDITNKIRNLKSTHPELFL